MDTAIIARPGESIKGKQTRPCGCVVEGGRAVERCGVAALLWDELIEARDATAADGRRTLGRKARIDAFAESREAYHRHIRGAVA